MTNTPQNSTEEVPEDVLDVKRNTLHRVVLPGSFMAEHTLWPRAHLSTKTYAKPIKNAS